MTPTETPTTEPTPVEPPPAAPTPRSVLPEGNVPGPLPRPGPQTEEQRLALIALLDKWIAEDEAGTYEHEDDGYDLLAALDANRGPHQRKLFPPEMKGKTW